MIQKVETDAESLPSAYCPVTRMKMKPLQLDQNRGTGKRDVHQRYMEQMFFSFAV